MAFYRLPVIMKVKLGRGRKDKEKKVKGGNEMKGTRRFAGGFGKVILAVLAAVTMPVLVWVALGAAAMQGTQTHITRRILATT